MLIRDLQNVIFKQLIVANFFFTLYKIIFKFDSHFYLQFSNQGLQSQSN